MGNGELTTFMHRHDNGEFWLGQRVDGTTDVHPRFIPYQSPSDYMSPTLEAGDLAEIDTTDLRPHTGGGLYLLRMPHGEPALRRLMVVLNGRVRVSCDVAPHDYEECDLSQLHILGRVTQIWNGRRI